MSFELLNSIPGFVWVVAGLGLAALMVLMVVRGLMRRSAAADLGEQANLSIDLTQLDATGPPGEGPRLEYYGTPVRLAVLVLAPSGRNAVLPPPERLRELAEHLLPGLSQALDIHKPIFRRWPGQLSSQGFFQSFFTNLQLPGNRGKGTPWCSVVGKFDYDGRPVLAGLVCCAERPNALSQVIVEHEGQWHDVLRVRKRET